MTEEERYAKIDTEKNNALNNANQMYQGLIDSNSNLAQTQKDYVNTWQNTQNEIADKNAAYQVELQNQNKEKAQKAYEKEAIASKNAYYDFINPYGANAEIQAQNGLNNTGYSETTKLGAWNTQQNRTASARSSLNDAKLQYDNAIKEIELNRDTNKSQYALEALKQQLDIALNEYNTSSQLQQAQLANQQALDSEYNDRYNTLWSQINTEKEQKEAIRQYEQNYALQKQQFQEDIRQFDENIKYLREKDAKEYELQIKKLEEEKRQAEQAQANWEREYQLSLSKIYSSGGSGGSSSSGGYKKGYIYTDYWSGPINSDAKYGTFSTKDYYGQSYQPNNIGKDSNGKVKYLQSSGKTVAQMYGTGNTGASGANIDNQTVWQYGNKYYVWDGSQNQYIKMNWGDLNGI